MCGSACWVRTRQVRKCSLILHNLFTHSFVVLWVMYAHSFHYQLIGRTINTINIIVIKCYPKQLLILNKWNGDFGTLSWSRLATYTYFFLIQHSFSLQMAHFVNLICTRNTHSFIHSWSVRYTETKADSGANIYLYLYSSTTILQLVIDKLHDLGRIDVVALVWLHWTVMSNVSAFNYHSNIYIYKYIYCPKIVLQNHFLSQLKWIALSSIPIVPNETLIDQFV